MGSTKRRATMGVLVALAFTVVACGGSDSSDPDAAGRHARAVGVLTSAGLTEKQAECMVGELGAEVVVEATDAAVLADGQPYKDAAEACLK